MRKISLFSVAIILFIHTGFAAQKKTPAADTVGNKYLKSMTWRNIGPFRGGRSAAVTGVPGKPNLYYFGATGGGVWQTTDAGNSWENISDGYFGGSIGAVAVSTSDNNVIYVGEGEETVRGNVSSGFGIWKSVDAGKTWAFTGLEDTRHISRIRIHPDNPDIVYVAAMGDLFKDTEDRGVYKTTDGGKTWSKILFTDTSSGAIDLILDPANSRVMYASTWTFRRTPYSFSSGGDGSKLFKSSDEGETWTELSDNEGFPQGLLGIIGVTVSPVNPDRVWAMVENEPYGGLYRSENAGETWKLVNNQRSLRQRAWYYTRIYADTRDEDRIYVMNVRYHVSKDGGSTFTRHVAPHGDHHDLWIAPEDNQRMIIGDDGGAQVSFDAGENWTTYMNQPTAQFYRINTDNHFPFRIYGAQQDNSSIRILHRSDGYFISERDWEVTAGGEAGHHAIEENNEVVYGGEYGGLMIRGDHRTRERQATNVWPDNPLGHGVENMKYRFQWNYPMFISPHNPDELYAFSNHVHVSADQGRSWKVISPDLTTNDTTKQGPSGGPITKDNTAVEYYCTIFSAVPSMHEEGVIWTGSDDGLIYITRDGGRNWNDITPEELPEFSQINSMEPDPFHPGGVYVVATRYKWGDYTPYIYYTGDYGQTWERIDEGIDPLHFTRVVRTDPEREGLLYTGTEYGLYISFNNGKNWQPFQNNLPIVPITDLRVKDRHLIAGTQGRSIWIIDDLSPLYELDYNWSETAHVFTPKPSYLMLAAYGGKSRLNGENHPAGAIINYYLEEVDTVNSTYQLRFLNDSNEELIAFSSISEKKEYLWIPKAGANRFIWDLRTSGVDKINDMILWWAFQKGPRVVPGTYFVQLIVDNDTMQAPLEVKIDPRVSAGQDDLQAQYEFLKDIRDNMNEINKTIQEIRDVRSKLNSLSSIVEDTVILKSIDENIKKGKLIEEILYQTKNKSPQDPLNFPIRLNNKYGHVGSLADFGFNRPTQQMYDVKEEFEEILNEQFKNWDEVKESISKLNEDLHDAKVPYIDINR